MSTTQARPEQHYQTTFVNLPIKIDKYVLDQHDNIIAFVEEDGFYRICVPNLNHNQQQDLVKCDLITKSNLIIRAMAIDWNGTLIVSTYSAIYRLAFKEIEAQGDDQMTRFDSKLTLIAGHEDEDEEGYCDGSGDQARFNAPCGIAVDNDGSIYVSDC